MLVASTNLQRTPLSVVKKLNKMKEAPQSAVTIVEDTQFSCPSHRTCRTPRLLYSYMYMGCIYWSNRVVYNSVKYATILELREKIRHWKYKDFVHWVS